MSAGAQPGKPRANATPHGHPQADPPATSGTPPAEWTAKFRTSNDYLSFVKDALPAAMAKDGRAAWYIAQALLKCSFVKTMYGTSPDPESQLSQELARMPLAPQWAKDLQAQQTRQCLGLAREDPFKDLAHRDGGYPWSYWEDQALLDHDPVALEQDAASSLNSMSPNMSQADRTDRVTMAEAALRAAVLSGDPDALFMAGMLLADGRYAADPLNGVAVALAACDLGRDCSAANPDNPWHNCGLSGACPADADYSYFMQQSLGPEGYAQVYARAQQIEQSVQARDWDALVGILTLRRDCSPIDCPPGDRRDR